MSIEDLLVPARLILIAVFITASFAKFANLDNFTKSLINLGIPNYFHKVIGFAVPYIEIFLVVFLIFPTTVWWASIIALILLSAFTALISYNLIQGKHPSCNCFGINNKPINLFTLLRNIGLIACSLLLISCGTQYDHLIIALWFRDISTMIGISSLFTWILATLVGIEGWIILKLIRQHGRLILRMDNIELRLDAAGVRPTPESTSSYGLEIGTQAPIFSLPNLNGAIVSLEGLLTMKKPILLVFSDPGCGPCTAMIPSLAQWENDLNEEVIMVLISRGTNKENMDKFGEICLDNVLLQTEREVSDQYKAMVTPCAVRINIDGLIDSNIFLGEVAIATLVHESISRRDSVTPNWLSKPI